MFASARRQISWMVASQKPRSANTSPAASSNRWRVSRERAEGGVMRIARSSRGRGAVACRRGSHGDHGIPAPWLRLGPKDEGEGGCGEECDQEGPHGNRQGTTHCDRTAEKPTPWNEGHCDLLSNAHLKYTFD